MVNASKDLSLMFIKLGDFIHEIEVMKANQMLQDTSTVQHEKVVNETIDGPLGKNVPVVKDRHVFASFNFVFELLFNLILVSDYWLMDVTVDVDAYGRNIMMHMFNNIIIVLIVVMT